MFYDMIYDDARALTIVGNESDREELLNRQIDYAIGESIKSSVVINHSATLWDLLSTGHLSVKRVAAGADKGGEYIIGCRVAPVGPTNNGGTWGRRSNDNLEWSTLVFVDIDNGQSIKETSDRLLQQGIWHYIQTSYSHNVTETFVTEASLSKFLKKREETNKSMADVVVPYLKETKKITDKLAASMVVDRNPIIRDDEQGYLVRHDPWPKAHFVLIPNRPFHFGAEVVTYQKFYAAALTEIGIQDYDKAGETPSQPMYTARIPKDRKFGNILTDSDAHGSALVLGAPLDVDGIIEQLENREQVTSRSALTRGSSVDVRNGSSEWQPTTPNLKKFMATDGSTFRVVDWMRDVQEEHEDVEIIKRDVDPDKVEYECPNVELHTGGRRGGSSPAYALQSVDGWRMGCRTDGCGDLYQGDRLRALDDFIQNTLPDGPLVKDAMELVRWCDEPESHDERTMDELIAELQPEDTIVSDRVQSVVKAIAKLPEWQHGQHARTVKDRTNCQKGDVDKAIKAAVKEAKASEKAKQKEIPTPDSLDLTTDHLRVYAAWGKDKLIETMTNFIVQRQQSDPTVFRRYDNAIAEIVPTDPPTLREMDRTHMKAYANHCVTAITIDKDRNESDDFIDGRVVDTVWNSANVLSQLPLLRSVVTLPVYGPNGHLITEQGYNPDTETYFAPNAEFLPVSDGPTQGEVDDAFAILVEATRDFPFSDDFSGEETLPLIYTDEPVEGAPGFFQPNLDRGYSSRLNLWAAMMTPFARNMIHGPCPVFLIDKPTPNTGATIMLKLMSYTINGTPETMKLFPSEDEEFSKVMLPDLLAGKPMIMYDNISHKTKIDSPFFAGVITSGNFEGRKLGQSLNVACPVSSIFVMAGNNISASGEVTRRMIPIRLDARTPRPGERKALFNMDVWAAENRARVVWGLLTLIQNWIAKDKPRFSGLDRRGRNLSTFEGWVSVIGGILEASGQEREQFLVGYDRYIETNLESQTVDQATIEWIFERYRSCDWTFKMRDFKMDMYPVGDVPLVDGFEPIGSGGHITTRGIKLKLQQLCNVFTIGEYEVRLTIDGRKNGWRLVRNDGGPMKEVKL